MRHRYHYLIVAAIMGVLFILCGSLSGEHLLSILLTILGVAAIGFGIFLCVGEEIALGAGFMVGGVVLIPLGWLIARVAILLIGLGLLAYAIYGIVSGAWMVSFAGHLVVGILMVLIFFGLAYAWPATNGLFIASGVTCLADGVLSLFSAQTAN